MKRCDRSFEESPGQAKRPQILCRGQRDVFVAFYHTLKAKNGISVKEYLVDVRTSGFDVAESTFYEWLRKTHLPIDPLTRPRHLGRPSRLTSEQKDILTGWVGHCFEKNIQVHLTDYIDPSKTIFDVKFGPSVAQRYLKESNITSQIMQVKNSGFKTLNSDLAVILWEWIENQRNLRSFNFSRSHMASIDFTFTGHRQDRQTTYAFAGSGQPKFLFHEKTGASLPRLQRTKMHWDDFRFCRENWH